LQKAAAKDRRKTGSLRQALGRKSAERASAIKNLEGREGAGTKGNVMEHGLKFNKERPFPSEEGKDGRLRGERSASEGIGSKSDACLR